MKNLPSRPRFGREKQTSNFSRAFLCASLALFAIGSTSCYYVDYSQAPRPYHSSPSYRSSYYGTPIAVSVSRSPRYSNYGYGYNSYRRPSYSYTRGPSYSNHARSPFSYSTGSSSYRSSRSGGSGEENHEERKVRSRRNAEEGTEEFKKKRRR